MGDEAEDLVSASLRAELVSLRVISPNRCIFRVTEHLRQINEEAYRPCIISFGPIYSQDPRLQGMQEQKLRHLNALMGRRSTNHYALEDYINFVREREEAAREYYAEEILLSSDDFVKMLLLDAAFIVEFFHMSTVDGSAVVEEMLELFHQVYRDLFREENQVPFFILEGLYNLAYEGMDMLPFIEFTFPVVCDSFGLETDETTLAKIITNASTIRHLVDFIRICLRPSILREELPHNDRKIQFPMSASELSAAGVKFVASNSKNLLDVRFNGKKGVLEIPKFTVHDATESHFRSILLLEQCCHFFNSYFLDYVSFIDHLIDTSEDVEILVKNGILRNFLGSNKEVADLFNCLVKNVSMNTIQFYYRTVSADLNEYASKSWNRWKAILKRDYFSHPWSIIAVIYAVVLLVLTILQTINSFKSNN